VHVNECNIFFRLSNISHSYKNDKWQRTCLIGFGVYHSAQLTPHLLFLTISVRCPGYIIILKILYYVLFLLHLFLYTCNHVVPMIVLSIFAKMILSCCLCISVTSVIC
jgi:hypothetical protein